MPFEPPSSRNSLAEAALAFREGRLREAEAILQSRLTTSPRETATYEALSDLLMREKRFDEAIEICERGLKIAPSDRMLQNNHVRSLVDAERFDAAIARLEHLLKVTPRFAQGHALLGTVHAKLGDVAAAALAFERATSLNPRDAVSRIALGECELMRGQAEPALAALERGLHDAPYDIRGLALKTLALAALGRVDEERALADPARFVQAHSPASLGLDAAAVTQLTRALSAFAADEPSLREDPPQYATKKAWHSTTNLAESHDPAIEQFKALIHRAFEARRANSSGEPLDHPFVRSAPHAYHIDMWAIRMQGGGELYSHIHADGWLSGVFYVEVPAIVNDPSANRAGWIEFGHPRRDIRLARSPVIHAVKPEPGLLITFPSYIWHATVPLPTTNNERRLCLAFDLHPRTT